MHLRAPSEIMHLRDIHAHLLSVLRYYLSAEPPLFRLVDPRCDDPNLPIAQDRRVKNTINSTTILARAGQGISAAAKTAPVGPCRCCAPMCMYV